MELRMIPLRLDPSKKMSRRRNFIIIILGIVILMGRVTYELYREENETMQLLQQQKVGAEQGQLVKQQQEGYEHPTIAANTSISSPEANDTSMIAVLETRVKRLQQCLDQLGKNGTWVQDWNFAKEYGQYDGDKIIYEEGPHSKRTWGSFKPTQEMPFGYWTSWRWLDYNTVLQNESNLDRECQVDHTLAGEKFCNVLLGLNISSIYFHGDSLMDSQYKSLMNKLGSDYVKNATAKVQKEATIVCNGTTNTSSGTSISSSNNSTYSERIITVLFVRDGGGQDFPHSPRNKITLTNTTRDFFKRQGRKLSVWNIGAHYHKNSDYEEDIEQLVTWIEELHDVNDLTFFRTTTSGHLGCHPRSPKSTNFSEYRVAPLANYSEFRPTAKWEWDMFDGYNNLTKELLKQKQKMRLRQSEDSTLDEHVNETTVTVKLLDVVNMTVLRQDGHSGGMDCLHYVSPGPIDWWNHLLYTHLLMIQEMEENFHGGGFP